MWYLLLACGPPATVLIGDPTGDDLDTYSDTERVRDSGDGSDSAGSDSAGSNGGDSGQGGGDSDDGDNDTTRVFNLDQVHEVEITLDDQDQRSLRMNPYTYVEAEVSWNGDPFDQVGVRIKGRLGSLRDLSGKSGFKVDLLEFGADKKLEGLEKINLNNMVQDDTQLKEIAAYTTYRAVGIPAPRVAYAWVKVNGEDFGLYSVVEDYDDEFLQANFADPSGNLYDGDYNLYDNGSYDLVDFNRSTQDMMGLDEGTDVGHADVHAVTEALSATLGSDRFEAEVGQQVDLVWFSRFWAVTAWIGQYDSYCYYSNNYRVYFDPSDGLARLMPWDPDWAFYASTPLTSPYGLLAQGCQADAACYERFKADLVEVGAVSDEVVTTLREASALIDPYFADDPRAEVSAWNRRSNEAALLDWYERRAAELERTFNR